MRKIHLCLEALELRAVPASVTDASDLDDYSTGVDPASGNPWASMFPRDYAGPNGVTSLPEAIRQINERGGNLDFQVPFVTLAHDLGSIERRVIVTGLKGADGAPGTVIDGGGVMEGLQLSRGGIVRNLVLNNFAGTALKMFGSGTVENNYIGTSLNGMSAIPNTGTGLLILASKVTVRNNILSGNDDDGVQVGGRYSGIRIIGNMIGVGKDGITAIPNGYGVVLHSGATNNLVGGLREDERNIISANKIDGVKIQLAHKNRVIGNFIGVNKNGAGNVGNEGNGITIEGGVGNSIGGVRLAERNIISGNLDAGVRIQGFDSGFGVTPASRNLVRGNLIGLDVNDADSGNAVGVILTREAQLNTIGGTVRGAGNIISHNEGSGILISMTGTEGNRVQGNTIGLDSQRFGIRGNTSHGVEITGGAAGNLIGGPTLSAKNVIAANKGDGVRITGSTSNGNIVAGNGIGLIGNLIARNTLNAITVDQAQDTIIGGTKTYARNVIVTSGGGIELRNAVRTLIANNYVGLDEQGAQRTSFGFGSTPLDGIEIDGGHANRIGTGTAAGRNLISGNTGYGISLRGNATSTVIAGNYIGTDRLGTSNLGNELGGILVADASETLIGGVARTHGNVIAANGTSLLTTGFGVRIEADNTILQSNLIGTDRLGVKPLPNTGEGIVIESGNANQINTVATPNAYNIIAHNGKEGIRIASGNGNTISANRIMSNGEKGIDLIGAANNGLGPLTISSIAKVGSLLNVTGQLGFAPSSTVRFELFGNAVADPSGSGEGQRYLGFVMAEVDALGHFVASFRLSIPRGYGYLSLTATHNNDTSEFSNTVLA